MKTIYTLCVATLVVAACKSPESPKKSKLVAEETFESVIKPIAGLEIAPRTFTVNASEASTIELPNGGSIEFPANAFVDEDGNPVKGKVDVHWKEFHSLTDIMLSGIPMKYDSLGKTYDFVSGGMFDISATANNQKVNLAKNKPATVNIASIDDTPCYNFYKLDEKTGDWAYKTTKPGEPMPKKEVPGANTEKPSKKESSERSKDFILDAQVNTDACPELKSQPIVGWRVLESVSPKDQKVLAKMPSDCKLQPGAKPGEYVLNVDMTKLKRSYKVKPFLISEAKLASRKNEVKEVKDYRELLAFQENVNSGKVIRSIEIANFGVYNWDKMSMREDLPFVAAEFTLPNQSNIQLASIYYVSPEENLIVNWSSTYGSKLNFDPKKKNGLVAVLPDNSLVAVKNDQFQKASKVALGGTFDFKFQETGIVLQSGKDVANYMNVLF